MKISTEYIHDVAIININGELDSRGNQMLDKTLKDLAAAGHYKVIIDLSSIRFVGSQTVSLLVSNLKEIRAGGGNIKFLNPQRAVMQYLKSNRIIELFQCYSTKNDAVLSYESSGGKQSVQPGPASSAKPAQRHSTASPAKTNPAPRPEPKPAPPPPPKEGKSGISPTLQLSENLQAGEILYANSCILASLVKSLEKKGILSSKEAADLLSYETE